MKHIRPPFALKIAEEFDAVGINSEQEIRARSIDDKIKEFGSKKGSFDSIFSREKEKWEEEAKKIIGDNEYLGMWWQIKKTEKNIQASKDYLSKTSGEEASKIKDDLKNLESSLVKLNKELVDRQRKDMASIK